MKEIALTKGKVALVDDEDYERLSQYKWRAQPIRSNFVAVREQRKDDARPGFTITMQMEIVGTPAGYQIDHINHDTLDNRRNNLRFCSRQQNLMNRRVRRDSQLAVKGVYHDCRRSCYWSRITINSRTIYLGTFKTVKEASAAYNQAAKIHHGEFACLSESEG